MITNKRLTEAEFLSIRQDVLRAWPTGNHPDLDLKKAVEKLKQVPQEKQFSHVLRQAKKRGITLVQPRAGMAPIDKHIELLQYLQNEGKADVLPSTIDSYTRHNRYNNAEDGIKESEKQGRSLLNGFPAVNYGVDGCTKVLDSINVPLQARHGTPDARLLSEIIHASGWTSNEGGGISYNIPYAKNISLEDTLRYWQYCDRLVGYYQEHGVELNREPFGPLTGTLVPPSIGNTVAIIEALLAAEQGVKNITVGYGQGGNMIQDIAALRSLEEQTNHYLKLFGYNDVFVTTVFHQWMGGFPANESEAMALIGYASTVAALGKATKMITKTTHESYGVPTKEANANALRTSRYLTHLLKDQQVPNSAELDMEINQIKREVDALLHAVVEAGKGDVAQGVVNAFKRGILDIPFAPSELNHGKVLPARDIEGKIRILEFGNLAFNDDIKTFHHQKLQERANKQHREFSIQMVIDDIYAVSDGHLVGFQGEEQ
ncbi:methylaspartate mutase subunit E [Candidatus Xianfuyuplasma coldseepsis]|uniref:Glutamate mutase epsilon subunit n=1 Tax=Candidatus Xianfuyuplasma coldseepsis TaxID=2782163 RepID=A0A7L7KNU4_9MOLU|nr:methylaspartate mutase subunit E [Xianfuyuplasma coldseepsis]QMS84327.1 methylaspartate mutase subunit E [Xianfuyuplasma coldseepsis]